LKVVKLRLNDPAHLDYIAGGNDVHHRSNVKEDLVEIGKVSVIRLVR
jgi:hypothetical protein